MHLIKNCRLGLLIYVVDYSLDYINFIFALGLISLLRITELYSTKNCRKYCVSLYRRIVDQREESSWLGQGDSIQAVSEPRSQLEDSGHMGWGLASVGNPGHLSSSLSAPLITSYEEPLIFSPPPSLCTFKNPQTIRNGRNGTCLVVKVRTVRTRHQINSSLAAQADVSSWHLWGLSGGKGRGRGNIQGAHTDIEASRKHTQGWLTNCPHVLTLWTWAPEQSV